MSHMQASFFSKLSLDHPAFSRLVPGMTSCPVSLVSRLSNPTILHSSMCCLDHYKRQSSILSSILFFTPHNSLTLTLGILTFLHIPNKLLGLSIYTAQILVFSLSLNTDGKTIRVSCSTLVHSCSKP